MNNASPALIDIKNIRKSFKKPDKQELLVIDHVSLTMHEGDVVALLGKSGSGKSTLLRIIAGLTAPSSGEVLYRGKPVYSPIPGISMVFQNFALMPWLTVLQNVELGLEALGVSHKERRERALRAIDMIGMDGFESAFPKELSGGMRQRVGFARALVVKPDLLIMDEPFSALDVLTAESLRNDLLELWHDPETRLKGILFVTHNIEEAVLVADRIVVFGSNPGFIRGELKIDLPHPRNSQDPAVLNLIDDVYTVMTSAEHENIKAFATKRKLVGLDYRLPEVGVAELIGLLEEVDELQQKGPVDLPDLANVVRLDIDTLFPVLEALSVLNLAKVSEGDIAMTSRGKELLAADITDKKVIFAKLLLQHIPLAQHVLEVLQSRPHHRISETYFKNELEDYFVEDEAERVLTALINWARYAEIFAYDYNTGMLSLEDVK
ncbi:MAG: nitrate/sulfonate/bicarbonate ABC transporter ATP-binding protein [Gammaproteobacteria bacterium]|nr:nitrate/sulfonate/bicarbonate ABC transporter ATP-binding protein [Gammaproteobacteria bacterium]